jgi:antitoxin (DNA-binding transcriptional repressor) of toxin-antitoxin stability system
MTTVTARETKTHLPGLLRAAERGETVIVTGHGKPSPSSDRRRIAGAKRYRKSSSG